MKSARVACFGLAGWFSCWLAAPRAVAEPYPGAPERVALAVSRTGFQSDLGELDQELGAEGYSTVSGLASGFGAELGIHFARFRVFAAVDGIFGTRTALRGDDRVELEQRTLSLALGYALVSGRYFSLLPRLGLGTTDLVIAVEAAKSPVFRDALSNAEGRVELGQGVLVLQTALHAEAWVPIVRGPDAGMILGAFFATNAGYAVDLNRPEWRGRTVDLGDLGARPSVDESGVFTRFLLGAVLAPRY